MTEITVVPLYNFRPIQEANPDLNEALRQIDDSMRAVLDILVQLETRVAALEEFHS